MYMYEIYTFYMPSTLPGVLHMLCNLILIIASCDTHIYFCLTNEKKKNGTLAGYLICLRSNGKEMEDALFGARCGSFKGHALFISE